MHVKDRKPYPVKLSDLVDRMCTKDDGGLCYEFDLLAYYVLVHIGFKVEFIEVDSNTIGEKWNPNRVTSHSVVLVTLDGKSYLLDPGCGFRGFRYPLEVDFSKEVNEVSLSSEENYKIVAYEDQYKISTSFLNDNNTWIEFYAWQRPIQTQSLDEIEAHYERLFSAPSFMFTRDSRFQSVIKTDNSILYTMMLRDQPKFVAFKNIYKRGQKKEKYFYKNYEEFQEDTIKLTGTPIPNRDQVIVNAYE